MSKNPSVGRSPPSGAGDPVQVGGEWGFSSPISAGVGGPCGQDWVSPHRPQGLHKPGHRIGTVVSSQGPGSHSLQPEWKRGEGHSPDLEHARCGETDGLGLCTEARAGTTETQKASDSQSLLMTVTSKELGFSQLHPCGCPVRVDCLES